MVLRGKYDFTTYSRYSVNNSWDFYCDDSAADEAVQ